MEVLLPTDLDQSGSLRLFPSHPLEVYNFPALHQFSGCIPTRHLRVVIGYGLSPDIAVEVITIYEPDPSEWHTPRVRRKR